MRKHTFKIYEFQYFGWNRNSYNSQNMGKVNSHNTEKVWEKINIRKLCLSNILGGFPWYGKSMGKHKYFKFMDFLNILDEAEIHMLPRYLGKVNLLSPGKVWENTEISHILRYLADLELMRTHTIPNVWECTNSHKMEIFCGKPYHSQAVGFWEN